MPQTIKNDAPILWLTIDRSHNANSSRQDKQGNESGNGTFIIL